MMTRACVPPLPLPSPEDEARAFHRLRWRLFRTRMAQGLATSRLRYALVVSLSILLWSGLFYLVYQGFLFMKSTLPLGTHNLIVPGIFNSFFLALFLMLVFSSSVILYGSLFRGGEVAYLFTLPVHEERIFHHHFQYSVLLSSWGFVLLGSPMLVAYGLVVEAPWYYFAMLLPMLVAFVYIPAGIGAILLLAIMYLFPRKRVQVLAAAACAAIAAAVWFCWSLLARPETELLTPLWFAEMLRRLQMTEARPLPNWWLSSGLLQTAARDWSEGVLFLALLIANALFFRELAGLFAAGIYRRAYWAAAGMGSRPARVQMGWFDRLLNFSLRLFSPQVRLILMKDVRLFRRDPLQWSQFLILVGLLLLYFVNVHRVGGRQRFSQWVNIVSFMNLSVVGLLMSTFTTRFVFPMASLEGRCFWLLGLLPLKRDTILWAKFLFSVGSLLVPCGLLVLLSDWRLEVPVAMVAEHQVTSLLLCVGLSGIGVGLGARLPLLTEPSPSRIAAGFGGTLNLVISTMFIVVVLVLMAMPYHVWLAWQIDPAIAAGSAWLGIHRAVGAWLVVWTLASVAVAVSAAAALVPMWIGIRTFRRQEFH
jgi:ABC-2 type transport system permease protein